MQGELERGELDRALDVGLQLPAATHREQLDAELLVVSARRDHPVVRGAIDQATYLALEHVLVTGRRHGRGDEDGVLDRLNASRRIRYQQHAPAKRARQSNRLAADHAQKACRARAGLRALSGLASACRSRCGAGEARAGESPGLSSAAPLARDFYCGAGSGRLRT